MATAATRGPVNRDAGAAWAMAISGVYGKRGGGGAVDGGDYGGPLTVATDWREVRSLLPSVAIACRPAIRCISIAKNGAATFRSLLALTVTVAMARPASGQGGTAGRIATKDSKRLLGGRRIRLLPLWRREDVVVRVTEGKNTADLAMVMRVWRGVKNPYSCPILSGKTNRYVRTAVKQ